MLAPLLPTEEECQTLRNYSGDRAVLGAAEHFLLQLMDVKHYKVRLDCMMLKEEFDGTFGNVDQDLSAIIVSCNGLKTSKNLQKVMYILLHIGNYLNHGAGVGNAVAFKLNSLWKIDELKGRKSGRSLLHLIVQETHRLGINLDDIGHVQDVAKIPLESLKSDVKTCTEKVTRLENQIKQHQDEFFVNFRIFLEESKTRLSRASSQLDQIEQLRKDLAIYFCENEKTFSLEECFKIFANFLSKYKLAENENLQREERQNRQADRLEKPDLGSRAPSPARLSSPPTPRKTSIVADQDRGRDSFPTLPPGRRKSSTRRESVLGPADIGQDLDMFVNQALEARKSSKVSVNPTVNEIEEVVLPVPKVDGKTQQKTNGDAKSTTVFSTKHGEAPVTRNTAKYRTKPEVNGRVNSDAKTVQRQTSKTNTAVASREVSSIRKQESLKGTPNPIQKTEPSIRSGAKTVTTVEKKTSPMSSPKPSTITSAPTSVPRSATARTNPDTTYARTILKRVTVEDVKGPKKPEPEPTKNAPMRRAAMARIRTKTGNELKAEEQKPTTITPLKPSDIRANRLNSSAAGDTWTRLSSAATASSAVKSGATTPLRRSTLPVDPAKRPPTTTAAKPAVPRLALSTRTSTSPMTTSPRSGSSTTTSPTTTTPPRRPMTATERRSLFKHTDSVSTASRPALIKTGSISDKKPRWS